MKGIFASTAFAIVIVLASGKDFRNHTAPEFPIEFPILDCPNCAIPESACDCSVDLLIIFDRSGSIDRVSYNNVREVVKYFIADLDYACSRTSVISFSSPFGIMEAVTVEYDFGDPEATTPSDAFRKINNMRNPGGATLTQLALEEACVQFVTHASPPGVCKVVALFTDGQSNNPAATLAAADQLNAKTNARVCAINMLPFRNSFFTIQRTLMELVGIVSVSHPSSGVLFNTDYVDPNFKSTPEFEQTLSLLKQCVCTPCF